MPNDYFNATGVPATNSTGSSAQMRGELARVAAGFDKLPSLAGNARKLVRVSGIADDLEASGAYVDDEGRLGLGVSEPRTKIAFGLFSGVDYDASTVNTVIGQNFRVDASGVYTTLVTGFATTLRIGNDGFVFTANDSLPSGTTFAPTVRLTVTPAGDVAVGSHSPTAKVDIDGSSLRLRSSRTPASSSASGNQGEVCWDPNYVYVCVAANTWRRAALAPW